MARKKYSTDEIIKHLRTFEIERAKGKTIEEVSKAIGVHPVTLAKWKREYGGMQPDQAKRLKELQKEHGRLKRMLADELLGKELLKEALEKKL